jgi:hypothetical protein
MPTKKKSTKARGESGASVADFLAQLPGDRRPEAERVRQLIRDHLPEGYQEVVSKNMLVYQVPFERYSDTYNGQPLWYVALSNAKAYLSLHLMGVYGDREQAKRLENGFRSEGKKLDMGKACVRFKSADELPLGVIGDLIAGVSVDRWVEIAQAARRR